MCGSAALMHSDALQCDALQSDAMRCGAVLMQCVVIRCDAMQGGRRTMQYSADAMQYDEM